MCRNIKRLFNFAPHATDDEVHAAALQYVRKISGFTEPSQSNEAAFNRAVEEIAHISGHLLDDLVTTAPAHNREEEAAKAHERAIKRFGKN
ncbi:MAG: DUF2277 domain-containing protein [Patescibacteria group bacterium]